MPHDWCTLPRRRPTMYVLFPSTSFPSLLRANLFTDRRIQDAIDVAKASFRELKDVELQRISFEVKVDLPETLGSKTAEIGRMAWPIVIASLVRFEIVEIRVAPVPVAPETMIAPSRSQASAVEPPHPHTPERSGYSVSQTSVAPYGPQITSLQSPSPPSLVTRILNLLTPKCFRSRLSP